MTCMEVICHKCGTKYFRGVFDSGCPGCSMLNTRSWCGIKEVKNE